MEAIIQIADKLSEEKKWKEHIDFLEHLLPTKPVEQYEQDDAKIVSILSEKIRISQTTLDNIIVLLAEDIKKLNKDDLKRVTFWGGISIMSLVGGLFPKTNTKYDNFLGGISCIASVMCTITALNYDGCSKKRLKEMIVRIRTIQRRLTVADKCLADRDIKKYREIFRTYTFSDLYDFLQELDIKKINDHEESPFQSLLVTFQQKNINRFYIYEGSLKMTENETI